MLITHITSLVYILTTCFSLHPKRLSLETHILLFLLFRLFSSTCTWCVFFVCTYNTLSYWSLPFILCQHLNVRARQNKIKTFFVFHICRPFVDISAVASWHTLTISHCCHNNNNNNNKQARCHICISLSRSQHARAACHSQHSDTFLFNLYILPDCVRVCLSPLLLLLLLFSEH